MDKCTQDKLILVGMSIFVGIVTGWVKSKGKSNEIKVLTIADESLKFFNKNSSQLCTKMDLVYGECVVC